MLIRWLAAGKWCMSEQTLQTLTWLIPAGPLLSFLLIVLFTKRNRTLSWGLAWIAIMSSLVMGWIVAFSLFATDTHELAHHPVAIHSAVDWLPIGGCELVGENDCKSWLNLGVAVDPLTAVMLFMVPFAVTMIFVYSVGYHNYGKPRGRHLGTPNHGKEEPLLSRFFALMSLFAGAMLILVVADNLLLLFIGWEIMGFCSYSLIGFWYARKYLDDHKLHDVIAENFEGEELATLARALHMDYAHLADHAPDKQVQALIAHAEHHDIDELLNVVYDLKPELSPDGSFKGFVESLERRIAPRQAAVKAFMTTRVADVVMLLGIVFFYRTFGTLNFSEALSAHSLEHGLELIGAGALGLMALFLFTGTVGKSAQWPLHVWLPDAMEGPTPVSAVIHAAAMVSAGVYLIVRLFPLLAVAIEANPAVGFVVAGIGAFTALMAATIAVAQNDVKGVLAYSTISQLGFMVAAIGIGAYIAAAFHLITHAFFKALLFLASGSVIHGMEHGAEHVHDHHTDPQNMLYMGGLRQKMPTTFWTFLIGGMALSGLPLVTAGFWSKDEIFADAWYVWSHDGKVLGLIVLIMLALAAFLTAFYTMRQISLTFLGEPRTPLAEHAHESNRFMTIPLVLLSIFAVSAGWVGIPDNFLGTEKGTVFYNYFHHFVGATIEEPIAELYEAHLVAHEIQTLDWSWTPLTISVVVALGGLFLGWWIYGRKPLASKEPDPLIAPLGPLHTFLQNKWYWDELYHTIFIRPVVYFSEVVVYEVVDKGLIDGFLHLVARTFYAFGQYVKRFEEVVISDGVDWIKDRFLEIAQELRQIQTGKIQEYTLVSMLIASTLALVILAINYGWLDILLN